MKIIYDRENAIKSMKTAEAKAAQMQQRKSLYMTLRIILATVLICSYAALCSCIRNNLTGANAVWIEFTVSVVYFVILAATLYYTRIRTAEDLYSYSAIYHSLTNQPDKTVVALDTFIEVHNITPDTLVIRVDLEDANHVASHESIRIPAEKYSFEQVFRTDVSEAIFDLDALAVYKPYIAK